MNMYTSTGESENQDNPQMNHLPNVQVKLPVQALQDQVAILDALVNYLEKYHGEVKQKCKLIYET